MWNDEPDEHEHGETDRDEAPATPDWSSLGDAITGGFVAGFGPGARRSLGGSAGRGGPRGVGGGRGAGRAGRGRRGPQPMPPWVADMLGFEMPPQRGGRGGGPKVRRGDVRAAILDVLAQEPRNGYQVIQEIAERSHGEWKPSPGSVYPTIQQLEDEGLVVSDESLGRRALRLTEEGVAYVDEHADELAAVWRPFEPKDDPQGPLPEIGQVMNALWQIVATGSDAQRRAALEVLADTRRRLYGILGEGDR